MVSLTALWLPVIVAAVVVFIAGFIMNMVLPHHRTDFAKLSDEDGFCEAVRAQGLAQGQYRFPHATTGEEMKDPAYQEKVDNGPVGLLIIGPNGNPLPKQLIQHFVYILVISLIAGYIGSACLPAGVDYLKVFQVVGCAAFLGYAGCLPLYSIWYHFTWSHTVKETIDALVYALLTAGIFGGLWPG